MRVLHFGDVHLGMTNFGQMDSATGLHTRVLDYLDALDILVDVAEVDNPDLVLFAGDAFRTRTPVPTLLDHFAERVKRLADIAPVVMVVGNHDRQKTGSARRHAIDPLRHIGARYPVYVEKDIRCIPLDCAHVITLPWQYNADVDNICDQIDDALECANGKPCVLVGHVAVPGAILDAAGNEYYMDVSRTPEFCLPLDVLVGPFDYVALGHVHKYQRLVDNPLVAYCGSLEYVTWGERDCPKGFILADVEPGDASLRHVDVDPRRLVDIRVDWDDVESLEDWDVDDAIVRVHVATDGTIDKGVVRRKVQDMLDGYWRLDAIDVEEPQRVRDRYNVAVAIAEMAPIDAVGEYLDGVYPDDPEYVDKLLDLAAEMMEEA